ncbi:MAG TPA: hypothetical protein VIK75_08645 [Calditerricola sp.]
MPTARKRATRTRRGSGHPTASLRELLLAVTETRERMARIEEQLGQMSKLLERVDEIRYYVVPPRRRRELTAPPGTRPTRFGLRRSSAPEASRPPSAPLANSELAKQLPALAELLKNPLVRSLVRALQSRR